MLDEEILAQPLDFKIEPLEDEFFQASTASDFLFLLEKYPEFAETYLSAGSYSNKEVLAEELLEV